MYRALYTSVASENLAVRANCFLTDHSLPLFGPNLLCFSNVMYFDHMSMSPSPKRPTSRDFNNRQQIL